MPFSSAQLSKGSCVRWDSALNFILVHSLPVFLLPYPGLLWRRIPHAVSCPGQMTACCYQCCHLHTARSRTVLLLLSCIALASSIPALSLDLVFCSAFASNARLAIKSWLDGLILFSKFTHELENTTFFCWAEYPQLPLAGCTLLCRLSCHEAALSFWACFVRSRRGLASCSLVEQWQCWLLFRVSW